MEIVNCTRGFVEEHLAYNRSIVHAVADLRIRFAVVDSNLKFDKSADRMNMS